MEKEKKKKQWPVRSWFSDTRISTWAEALRGDTRSSAEAHPQDSLLASLGRSRKETQLTALLGGVVAPASSHRLKSASVLLSLPLTPQSGPARSTYSLKELPEATPLL